VRGAIGGLALLLLPVGCGSATSDAGPAFAISTYGLGEPSLTVLDRHASDRWAVVSVAPFGSNLVLDDRAFVSFDSGGRAWIARHGDPSALESSVLVYTDITVPMSTRVTEVATCAGGHRVVFVGGSAFVACEGDGFRGVLARIRLDTLAVDGTLQLSFPDSDAFTVTAAGVVGGMVAVAGNTNGGAGVLFVDPDALAVVALTALGPSTSIADVLATGEDALFLNVLSGSASPAGSVADVFEISSPSAAPRGFSVVPSPSAGVVVGGDLILYSTRGMLGRSPLAGGAPTTWASGLPGVVDTMATDGTHAFVAHHETAGTGARDGIYEVDPSSERTTLRLDLPSASELVIPGPSRN
jgi:hypothetical protein